MVSVCSTVVSCLGQVSSSINTASTLRASVDQACASVSTFNCFHLTLARSGSRSWRGLKLNVGEIFDLLVNLPVAVISAAKQQETDIIKCSTISFKQAQKWEKMTRVGSDSSLNEKALHPAKRFPHNFRPVLTQGE